MFPLPETGHAVVVALESQRKRARAYVVDLYLMVVSCCRIDRIPRIAAAGPVRGLPQIPVPQPDSGQHSSGDAEPNAPGESRNVLCSR